MEIDPQEEKEIEELIYYIYEIPEIRHIALGNLPMWKSGLKQKISDTLQEKTKKIIPLIKKKAKEYCFQLEYKSPDHGWELTIENDPDFLPQDSIVPPEIIDIITKSDSDSNIHNQIEFKSESYDYKVYFTKEHSFLFAGRVYKIKKSKNETMVIDISQYLNSPLEKQWEIIKVYAERYPEAKKELSFLFFTKIMPRFIKKIS